MANLLNYQTGMSILSDCLPGCAKPQQPDFFAIMSGCSAGSTASSYVGVSRGNQLIYLRAAGTLATQQVLDWNEISPIRLVTCGGEGLPQITRLGCIPSDCCNNCDTYTVNVRYFIGCANEMQDRAYTAMFDCNCGVSCSEKLSQIATKINADSLGLITATVVDGAWLQLTGTENGRAFNAYGTCGIQAEGETIQYPVSDFGTSADLQEWLGGTDFGAQGSITASINYALYEFGWSPKIGLAGHGGASAGGNYNQVTGQKMGIIAIPTTCTSIRAQLCSILDDPNTAGLLSKIVNCDCPANNENYFFCMIRDAAEELALVITNYTDMMGANFVGATFQEERTVDGTTYSSYKLEVKINFLPSVGNDVPYISGPEGCTEDDWYDYFNDIPGDGSTSGTAPI